MFSFTNVLNFFLFMSIFLGSTAYVYFRELHILRIMVPLILLVTLLRFNGKLIVPHYVRYILLLLLIYLLYMYVITIVNGRGISANDFVNYSFLYLMSIAIFIRFSNDEEKIGEVLFYVALLFYIMNIGLGYYEYLTGWHLPGSNILDKRMSLQHVPTTFYTNQNDFAAMHFLVFVYLYKYSERFLKPSVQKIILLLLPISIYLYVIASSRIVLIAILIWLVFELRLKKLFQVTISVLFAFVILYLFYNESFDVTREVDLAKSLGGESTNIRLALYWHGLRSIVESYGLGFGINATPYYYSGLKDPALGGLINAHSYIIELIINGGIVALFGYVGLVSYMAMLLRKDAKVEFIKFSILYTFLLFSSSSSLYLWGHYLIFVGYWYILLDKGRPIFSLKLATIK